MSHENWPELLTQHCDKPYRPKTRPGDPQTNTGYRLTHAVTIRADGKDMPVPSGGVLQFDYPGVVSVRGKIVGGTDSEIQLSAITLIEAK